MSQAIAERPRLNIRIRPYQDDDGPRVLTLLGRSLHRTPVGEWSPEFFRWKHIDNAFGRSLMYVAEADGDIVGFRSFMRWNLSYEHDVIRGVRAVDTATDPTRQRSGIFSQLTAHALSEIQQEADLVFNTPNEKSLPGYLKLGWRPVGDLPVSVRVIRPIQFAKRVRSLRSSAAPRRARPYLEVPTAGSVFEQGRFRSLLEESEEPGNRLRTRRSVEYFQWRYGVTSGLDYRALLDERGGELRGIVIFRVRARGQLWEGVVSELIAPPGDARAARRLLGATSRLPVDHVTCHFPAGGTAARAAVRKGFIRLPGGMTFVTRPLAELSIDVTRQRCWALSLGDLEVF